MSEKSRNDQTVMVHYCIGGGDENSEGFGHTQFTHTLKEIFRLVPNLCLPFLGFMILLQVTQQPNHQATSFV